MQEHVIKNNLFSYATSELSQDAFLCYFLSFASKENEEKDSEIAKCARNFLRKCLPDHQGKFYVSEIKQQYEHIDVLITVDDYKVIIEDKTFTGTRKDQIADYYKKICEEFDEKHVKCVYYKIVEQCWSEKNAENISRNDMLEVLDTYHGSNIIVHEYKEYLLEIQKDVQSYTEPIKTWRSEYNHVYGGFFTHLIRDGIIQLTAKSNWDYVPNASNGFWGFWWRNLTQSEKKANNIPEEIIEDIYLQIEDDIIAVKVSATNNCPDKELAHKIRLWVYDRFKECIPEFEKKRMRRGKHMTAGYIQYDEKNYKEKIKKMEKAMSEIGKGSMPFSEKI